MELKYCNRNHASRIGCVLIVPYGIEIHIDRLNEEARLCINCTLWN